MGDIGRGNGPVIGAGYGYVENFARLILAGNQICSARLCDQRGSNQRFNFRPHIKNDREISRIGNAGVVEIRYDQSAVVLSHPGCRATVRCNGNARGTVGRNCHGRIMHQPGGGRRIGQGNGKSKSRLIRNRQCRAIDPVCIRREIVLTDRGENGV